MVRFNICVIVHFITNLMKKTLPQLNGWLLFYSLKLVSVLLHAGFANAFVWFKCRLEET